MRRFPLHLITALLTFSISYSLFLVAEIRNLKVEIREYERRAEAEKVEKVEYVARAPQRNLTLNEIMRNLTVGEIMWRLQQGRCRASKLRQDKARRVECAEYDRILFAERHFWKE
jgi:hypothetical protein